MPVHETDPRTGIRITTFRDASGTIVSMDWKDYEKLAEATLAHEQRKVENERLTRENSELYHKAYLVVRLPRWLRRTPT